MKKTTLIFKTVDGIKYQSDEININGDYILWRSKSHPQYKHWSKTNKNTSK